MRHHPAAHARALFTVAILGLALPIGCSSESGDSSSSAGGAAGAAGSGGEEPTVQEVLSAQMASRYCEAKETCDCGAAEDCQDWATGRFVEKFQEGEELGLQWDESCTDETLARFDAFAQCGPSLPRACCKMMFGSKQEGEACASRDWGDACAQGLECRSGSCVPMCSEKLPRSKEGEACSKRYCETGLACLSGFCVQASELGEKCGEFGCGQDRSCVNDLCVPVVGRGEPCGSIAKCNAETSCNQGVCGDLLPNGASCATGNCASGFCLKDICEPFTATFCYLMLGN